MKIQILKFKIGLSLLLSSFLLNAQESDTSLTKIMNLGEVEIVTFKKFDDPNKLDSKEIQAFNKVNVADALNMVSGVHITRSGARNDSLVSLRGFGSRQIPIYIDGIPVYIPYDGLVDLARFTTADIERIDVSKGFSSIIYGPNSLGGAINLVSSKPREKFEFNGSLGMINNNGYKATFSWAEIYNNEVGNGVYVLFEENGLPIKEKGDMILISKSDIKTGPRHVFWLSSIEVNKVE